MLSKVNIENSNATLASDLCKHVFSFEWERYWTALTQCISACQEAHQDKEDLDACTLGCDSQVNIVAKKKQKFSQVRKHNCLSNAKRWDQVFHWDLSDVLCRCGYDRRRSNLKNSSYILVNIIKHKEESSLYWNLLLNRKKNLFG